MFIELIVNDGTHGVEVEPRTTLLDCLRDNLGLTGAHAGCEHGMCGACTILLDGAAVPSCLIFAVQADGIAITTIEGVAPGPGELSPVQDAFCETHGLQCGYCTPAIGLTSVSLRLVRPPRARGPAFRRRQRPFRRRHCSARRAARGAADVSLPGGAHHRDRQERGVGDAWGSLRARRPRACGG